MLDKALGKRKSLWNETWAELLVIRCICFSWVKLFTHFYPNRKFIYYLVDFLRWLTVRIFSVLLHIPACVNCKVKRLAKVLIALNCILQDHALATHVCAVIMLNLLWKIISRHLILESWQIGAICRLVYSGHSWFVLLKPETCHVVMHFALVNP